MIRFVFIAFLATFLSLKSFAQKDTIEFRVIQTSDIHGCFFPENFITREPSLGSCARISHYVKTLRETLGDRLLLLDAGDILQGQPVNYYFNYIKPDLPNIAATVINYMGYDAQAIGNHDIETGHKVYDAWIQEVKCPMLGANVISTVTLEPYLKPYTIIERDGIRFAILGMITPAIPNWLDEELWQGLSFEDMTLAAKKWIPIIKEKENPDIIIGLFHSGWDGGIVTDTYEEDASKRIAEEVPGFDLILYGHDHKRNDTIVKNSIGENVLCLDPSNNALNVSDATIKLILENKKVVGKEISGTLTDVRNMPIDEDYMKYFQADIDSVNNFVSKKIGTFSKEIFSRDCFFGSSPFCDLIHNLQLRITNAEVSFAAPLSFNISVGPGDIYVGDMFNLYRFENKICVLRMTGKEIRDHLEMSYDLWTNTMTSKDDDIMLLSSANKDDMQKYGFKNFTFNFDSAAGIDYEVDVRKPIGEKVHILKMSNGEPFDENRWYTVAMNSYRANGGGELLTLGAKIPKDSLSSRMIYESDKDQRYYLMLEIEKEGVLDPKANNNWRFVPLKWTKPAIIRDKEKIFGVK